MSPQSGATPSPHKEWFVVTTGCLVCSDLYVLCFALLYVMAEP